MGVRTYAIHSLYDLAQPTLRQHGQAPVCFVYVVFRNFVNNVLGVHQVKKRKVQELTEKQKAVRYDRGKKFLKKYLTRRKLKLLFTMDETMIRTSDLQGQSTFYYKGSRVVVPEDLQNWPKQILVAMGICWYGKSRLYVVPEKTKVNSDVFIKKILKPMVTYNIPRLFGNKKHMVIFHMDPLTGPPKLKIFFATKISSVFHQKNGCRIAPIWHRWIMRSMGI